jgi:hypothetical protein
MNGLWTRAWLAGLMLAAPSLALAQDTAPSSDPAPGQAPAGDAPPATDAAPAPKVEEKKDEKKSGVANLGAAALALGSSAKPWRVLFTFEQTLGAGAFVSEPTARTSAYGWNLSALLTYTVTPLGDGRLVALARASASQQLTVTSVDLGTRPREFFLQDLQLGLTAPGVLNFKDLGLLLGGGTSIFLPTSKFAQGADRVLRWQFGPSLLKLTPIGPGTLAVQWNEAFRKDFGPRVADIPRENVLCRGPSDDCLGNIAQLNFALVHTLSVNYDFGGALSFNVFWQIANNFHHDLSDSELPPGFTNPVGRSPNAAEGLDTRMVSVTSLSANYTINDNWFVTGGVSTFGPMLIQRGDNPRALRFPFFDLDSTANNLTSFFLDVNFTY